jgi:peptidoglycan/LPS O-acetylase OafA/YrhL
MTFKREPSHRTDIDGLRGIAVLSVVINHAGSSLLPGGFTGVDVFFVISGFLITKIILKDIEDGTFSLTNFYIRRIRRIFPALVVVMLAAVGMGYFTMLPDSFENLAQSVVATTLFANNILLSVTSGYWDIASEFKPLLHTWSLGVEEQFYIVFPLVALFTLRFGRAYFAIVIVFVLSISLFLSSTLTDHAPTPSFYLPHTRIWELLIGAFGALVATRHRPKGFAASLLSMAGLVLVIASALVIHKDLTYPSYIALFPCLGAFLLLVYNRPGSLTHRALSIGPLAFAGTISYSVYLWHQPVFAYARIMSVEEPPLWQMATLTALVLCIGYVSWRFVEQPFRDRSKVSSQTVLVGFLASSGLLLVVGLGIYRLAGLPERDPSLGLVAGRYIAFNEGTFRYKLDSFSDPRKQHILVVGNSTGRDLINIMLASGRFQNDELVYRDDINICDTELSPTLTDLVSSANSIVIAANWSFDLKCSTVLFTRVIARSTPVILVGPKHFGYNLDGFIHVAQTDRPDARATLLPGTTASNAAFSKIVAPTAYVDVLAMMNSRFGGVPVFDATGRILSVDRVHLTEAGAAFFASFLFDNPAWATLRSYDTSQH